MRKRKGFTLVEVVIVVAIAGLFGALIMDFFTKSTKIRHSSGIKHKFQMDTRFLIESFFMDVNAGYKFNSLSSDSLSIEVFSDIPSSSDTQVEPTTETAEYSLSGNTLKRTFRGKTESFYNVKEVEFKYLDKDGKETSSEEEAVGAVIKVSFEEKEQTFNIITSAFMRSRQALKMFGTTNPGFGYFSSLEDSSF